MLAIAAVLLFQFTPSLEAVSIADVTPVTTYAAARASKNPPDASAADVTDESKKTESGSAPSPSIAAKPESTESRSSAVSRLADTPHAKATEVSLNYSLFSTIRISEPSALKPTSVVGVESMPSRRNWIVLAALQHSAAAFDAYSTRDAISNGAVERDPLLRPFAGSSGIYAAIQVVPVALDYTARKMQRSGNGFIRRMWWVPQSASTAGFLFSGAHNLRVAGQP